MIQNVARQCYLFAKRSPRLRKLIRLPIVARFKAALATRLAVGDKQYERWLLEHRARRLAGITPCTEPSLLSFLTTVWNTPAPYLQVLADSLLNQSPDRDFEWILLDNGTTDPQTRACLQAAVASDPRVKLFRVEDNLGIVGGMRFCLERATGRYVLPLDSDDYLYPDATAILKHWITSHNFPPLLYSDEDHLLGRRAVQPYFKPDWDPVLFLNSAYIAHLCAIDRHRALELDVYAHADANGCHDWDTFLKFMAAGHVPVHISEMLYSWRMHARSTASNINSKNYIHQSHQAVLGRYLARRPAAARYHLEPSPLFDGTPDWWIRRSHVAPRPILSLVLCEQPPHSEPTIVAGDPPLTELKLARTTPINRVLELVETWAPQGGLVRLISEELTVDNSEWPWEALALMELHPDVAVVGGPVHDRRGVLVDAGRYLGFGDGCGCPDIGRTVHDRGYFAQLWKQRSVSAVSTRFCVFDAAFLTDLLRDCGHWKHVSLAWLGAWAGAFALRTGRRVVYSPFFSAASNQDWYRDVSPAERAEFLATHHDILPDRRFYSKHLSLSPDLAYRPAPPAPLSHVA